MNKKEILDSFDETENGQDKLFSIEFLLILFTIGLHISAYIFGDTRASCGINLIDVALIIVVISLSVVGYKLVDIKVKSKKIKWLSVLFFCFLNLWMALMFISVIC